MSPRVCLTAVRSSGIRTFDEHYPGQWISHGGRTLWALMSPNLTLYNFSVRVFVKDAAHVPHAKQR